MLNSIQIKIVLAILAALAAISRAAILQQHANEQRRWNQSRQLVTIRAIEPDTPLQGRT